jgi:hypothetical protein
MEDWCSDPDRIIPNNSDRNLSQCHFSAKSSTRTGLGSNPALRGEGPAKSANYEASNYADFCFSLLFLSYQSSNGSRDSSVSIVPRLWAGRNAARIPAEARDLYLIQNLPTGCGPTRPPI